MPLIDFPIFGLHRGLNTTMQPDRTSPHMKNVRPFDALDGRARGGQRPGIKRWGDGQQIGGAEQPVTAMCVVNTVE